jgi:hypothetical protein
MPFLVHSLASRIFPLDRRRPRRRSLRRHRTVAEETATPPANLTPAPPSSCPNPSFNSPSR